MKIIKIGLVLGVLFMIATNGMAGIYIKGTAAPEFILDQDNSGAGADTSLTFNRGSSGDDAVLIWDESLDWWRTNFPVASKGPIANVKAWEATGNGSTDDSAAVIAAEDAVDNDGGVLFFPGGTYRLSANVTISSNVTMQFSPGAKLSIDSGKTVTVSGKLEAGLYQIFDGDGSVTLSIGSCLYVLPEWWGAVGDDSTECHDAIQSAIDAANNVGMVRLGSGTYRHATPFEKFPYGLSGGHNTGIVIQGSGMDATILKYTGTSDYGIKIWHTDLATANNNQTVQYVTIRDLQIDAPDAEGGIDFIGCQSCMLERVAIHDIDTWSGTAIHARRNHFTFIESGMTHDTDKDFTTTGKYAFAYQTESLVGGPVVRVTARMKKTGDPEGMITASVYTNVAGKPGAILGSASEAVFCDYLSSAANGADQDFIFTWGNVPQLSGSTWYWIVFETDGYTYSNGVTEVIFRTDAGGASGNLFATYTGTWATANFGTNYTVYQANKNMQFNHLNWVQIRGVVGAINARYGIRMEDDSQFYMTHVEVNAKSAIRGIGATRVWAVDCNFENDGEAEPLYFQGNGATTFFLNSWIENPNLTKRIAAHLDGDTQYFRRDDADFPESGITGDLTIQAWVKLDYGSENDVNDIVRKFRGSGQYCYLFRFHNGKLRFYVSTDGTAYTHRATTEVIVEADVWMHVAVTYDASAGSCIFYKNGEALSATGSLANSIFDGTSQFNIGSYITIHNLDGSVYNVALFNDIRTPAEISASYADDDIDLSGEGNIVAQWLFEDDGSATAIDNSQGDAGRDLTPYDGGDVTYENCGREHTILSTTLYFGGGLHKFQHCLITGYAVWSPGTDVQFSNCTGPIYVTDDPGMIARDFDDRAYVPESPYWEFTNDSGLLTTINKVADANALSGYCLREVASYSARLGFGGSGARQTTWLPRGVWRVTIVAKHSAPDGSDLRVMMNQGTPGVGITIVDSYYPLTTSYERYEAILIIDSDIVEAQNNVYVWFQNVTAGHMDISHVEMKRLGVDEWPSEFLMFNPNKEDTDSGRDSRLSWVGRQSGGEQSFLATITASHDGAADDEKGELAFAVNDGNDAFSPSKVGIKIIADGGVFMAELKSGINQATAGAATGELWVDTDDDNTIKLGI